MVVKNSQEGFYCFFSENRVILASSRMQEAASSDFQQIGQWNLSPRSRICGIRASLVFPWNLSEIARFCWN